jgi:hypothetical protein
MKFKYSLIIFIVLLIAFSIYGYFKAIPGLQENKGAKFPKVELSLDSFDFGQIEYGQIAEHTFKVKNSGQEVLEIKRLSTSCACTSAEIEKETLNPGEEVNLWVEYNTGLMTGDHAKGNQERIIYIKTNDPINPQVEITIKAYVK